MTWANGSSLAGTPQAHAKHKRLALIRRRHNYLLRQQQATERIEMDSAIQDLDELL